MEEIKLPKFKTKEELEQFAMGLMTENEALKTLIKCKDESIKNFHKDVLESLHLNTIINSQKSIIKRLESEVESLKENLSEDKHKELYDKERREHVVTMFEKSDVQIKLSKAERMVYKLTNLAIFMYGLLNRFQSKQVLDAYGEFNPADYRL